jgi:CubicO group peptidase (beta-lactamase class C family)
MLAHDGTWRDRQVIPEQWIMDATTVRADQPHLMPGTATPIFGYAYQTWILPTRRRMFMLWGIRGQRIFVDPRNRLVMVNTAVHKLPADLAPLEEMGALWFAVVRQFGSL